MKKIPTLFVRDGRGYVVNVANLECQWVLDGQGVATRKWDGTCVMIDEDAKIWTRREVRPGKQPPAGFVRADHDPVTGKTVGWEPYDQSGYAGVLATIAVDDGLPAPGTYELIGPKVNGNPERSDKHRLVPHGKSIFGGASPRDFDGLRDWFASDAFDGIEGVVWWHSVGRRAKLKRRDFPA